MSIITKYRPDSFDSYLGNQTIISALKEELGKKDHFHSFLIEGESGIGKTTLGRILAKELNAQLVEINAANFNGIGTARELIEQISGKPLFPTTTVYLFDEFHQASKDMIDGLLKPVEEPPSWVYFVFATTDTSKIADTFKRRCFRVKLTPPSPMELVKKLMRISKQEGVELHISTIEKIVEVSNNLPGACLNNLGKVMNASTPEEIPSLLELPESNPEVIDFCRAISKKEDWTTLSKMLKDLTADPESVRRAVLGYMSAVLLNSRPDNKHPAWVIECFSNPFYNTGKPGLVKATFDSLYGRFA